MKKKSLILLLFLSLNFSGFAKKEEVILPEDENGKIVFTDVVTVENTPKDVLYLCGLEWFINTYGSGKYVIQLQDKEAGKIVGNAVIPVDIVNISRISFGVIKYSVSLYFKDNRYKYSIDDFYHDGSTGEYAYGKSFGEVRNIKSSKLVTKRQWNSLKARINENITHLIESLKVFMSKKAEEEKKDW